MSIVKAFQYAQLAGFKNTGLQRSQSVNLGRLRIIIPYPTSTNHKNTPKIPTQSPKIPDMISHTGVLLPNVLSLLAPAKLVADSTLPLPLPVPLPLPPSWSAPTLVPVFDGFSVVRTCGVTFVIFAAFAALSDESRDIRLAFVVVGVARVYVGSFFVKALRKEAIAESTASDVWGLFGG